MLCWNDFETGIYNIASMENKFNAFSQERMDNYGLNISVILAYSGGMKN
jgi:hypothetical protein